MFSIKNLSPSTFFSRFPVIIRDGKGELFYFHPNEEKEILFNLPQGNFVSQNACVRSRKFVPYELKPIKNFNPYLIPKGIKEIIGSNENKATISLGSKKILLDPSIANCKYSPVKTFVTGHEIGHYIFNENPETDEENCDLFSYNLGMLTGFNPNQYTIAKHFVFKNNPCRKANMTNFINEVKTRR